MKKYSLAVMVGAAILSVVPASANTTTFNFSALATSDPNPFGDVFTQTATIGSSTLTVTETAFYLAAGYTNPSNNAKFQTAAVDNYNGSTLGLGICSVNDGGPNCTNPTHQVDNKGGTDEFILFTFSGAAVSLGTGSSITVANYAPDGGTSTAVDLTYYSAATAINTNTLYSAETGGVTVDGNAGSGNPVTYGLTGGSTVTYLLVGAAVGESIDAFKINSLTVNDGVNATISGTPEPATFGLIGLALAGLGAAYSRKRKANRS